MMQNHWEISSKNKFWTRNVRNCSKSLTESLRKVYGTSKTCPGGPIRAHIWAHKGPYGPIYGPIRAYMGPYGPQPGPGPNPDWSSPYSSPYSSPTKRSMWADRIFFLYFGGLVGYFLIWSLFSRFFGLRTVFVWASQRKTMQNHLEILSNGAVWTRNVTFFKKT